jgi:hypothetical protein
MKDLMIDTAGPNPTAARRAAGPTARPEPAAADQGAAATDPGPPRPDRPIPIPITDPPRPQ